MSDEIRVGDYYDDTGAPAIFVLPPVDRADFIAGVHACAECQTEPGDPCPPTCETGNPF